MTHPKRSELLRDVYGRRDRPSWVRGRLLRTGEVAAIFQVSRRTITDWARRGKIPSVMTPGGQRRFPAAAVADALAQMGRTPEETEASMRGAAQQEGGSDG